MGNAMTPGSGQKVAVIGAGPMGLACAYRLATAGCDVSVYEADDRIGGMSASFDFDGLQLERYYHFICKPDKPLFDVLDEFGLADRLRWRSTEMGFYYDGRMYRWGRPDCLLRFPHLSLIDKIRYAFHVLYTKSISDWRALDRKEATEWLRSWVGARSYEVLWERLFDLKFYEQADQLSAAWIGTRIKRVALSRRSLFQEELGYLEGGSQVLLDAYESRLKSLGARFLLNTPVEHIVTGEGRVTGVQADGEVRPADAVYSTVPLKYVPRIAPDLGQAERERIASIDNIGVVCVLLKLKRPFTDYFWMNVNDRRLEIPGIIEYTNLNPLSANVVYFPYYMPKTHVKWQWEDRQFIAEVIAYARTIRPDWDEKDILASHVARYEFAQTVCGPGFFDKLPPMETSVRGFYMADTAYYYPEDRSISESISVGKRLAETGINHAA